MNIDREAVIRNVVLAIGTLVLIPVVAVGALAISARSSDGPSVIFSGGPLESGELVTDWESDWNFVRNVRTFELQLLNPPKSRTLWIVEVDGKLYLNSNYMGGLRQRYWKQWPAQAEEDGRGIMRIGGKRYPFMLTRIKSGPVVEQVTEAFTRKYSVEMIPAEVDAQTLWLFEIAPRDVTGGSS
jgi:hypothetical protein